MILEDFYAEVLKKLEILEAEENPEPSDRQEVVNKYTQVHAEYVRNKDITWFDDEDVPDWAADSFASIVAYRLVKTFGLPAVRRQELKVDVLEADRVIVGDGQSKGSPRAFNNAGQRRQKFF